LKRVLILAIVTVGRLSRFTIQLLFNLFIFKVFIITNVVDNSNLSNVGGYYGISVLTTTASQGIQYICIMLANREIGNINRNVMLGLSFNIVVTAASAKGIKWMKPIFLFNGIIFGMLVFGVGMISDFRRFYPEKRGGGNILWNF